MKIEEKDGKLVITGFNEFEVYRIAIAIEEDGVQFYGKLSQATSKSKVKETLEFLKKEEMRHASIFEQLLQEMRDRGEDRAEDNDILNSIDFGIFKPYQSLQELQSVLTDTPKAIKLGLIIEKKSIVFYQACKKRISSKKVADELKVIIKEEQQHKAILERMLKG